jgi:uncharacterized protein DUF5671
MILRRLYLYLVSAAALVVLAAGLVLLGATVVLFVFNDPSADSSRGALAIFTAMTVVALPVWAVHFGFGQRFALRDPYERASALRRLYLYWACLVSSLAATIAISFATQQLLQPVLDGLPLNAVTATQLGWAILVLAAIWAAHFLIAWRDRAAAGEEGASATLRRWYMYIALLAGLMAMLVGTASLLQVAWRDLALGTNDRSMSGPAGLAIAGLVLWGVHARVIAIRHAADDRHSTLRALEGFIAVAISIAVALTGASQILYYLVARLVGVDNPGNAGTNFVAAAAGPGSQLIVFGVAWFLVSRRLTRDAATQEADRQAAIRRLYTNLATLISLGALALGAGMLLWNLAEQVEGPIIGVTPGDWKDPVSISVTLLVAGGAVWVAHWRPSPWAADRQSLSRKLYVWAALLGSILGILLGGVGIVNAALRQLFSSSPRWSDQSNLDVGHFLAVILVAAVVGFYHWRILRADAAARPPRPAHVEEPKAQPVAPERVAVAAAPEEIGPHARRYTLVVTDATDDDVHQALANLPPAASYKLTHAEQAVDGH